MTKIAIIGTANHRSEAPYSDPSWTVWGVSPKNIGQIPRWDEWFELHDFDVVGDFGPELKAFLKTDHGKPVWMHKKYCTTYPVRPFDFDAMRKTFGEFFFTSSIAWMLAKAILENPSEIGIWGVDMGHETEYRDQRAGCQHFISVARDRGIRVTLPPQSKLHARSRLYGLEGISAVEKDLRRRVSELKAIEKQSRRNADMQLGALTVLEDILRAEFPE